MFLQSRPPGLVASYLVNVNIGEPQFIPFVSWGQRSILLMEKGLIQFGPLSWFISPIKLSNKRTETQRRRKKNFVDVFKCLIELQK
jgi:hypothetical protein